MKKSIVVCDKCEKVLITEKAYLFSLFKERKSNGVESEDYNWEADLCMDCLVKLATRLTQALSALGTDKHKEEIAKQFNCKVN